MPLRVLCLHISDGGYGSELSFQKQACCVESTDPVPGPDESSHHTEKYWAVHLISQDCSESAGKLNSGAVVCKCFWWLRVVSRDPQHGSEGTCY